jgi:uncharacterized protein
MPPSLSCPKCKGRKLTPVSIDGTEVDRCAECGGVWFDKGELGEALRHGGGALAPLTAPPAHEHSAGPCADHADDPDRRRGRCPRHAKVMIQTESLRVPDLTLETCPSCRGIWLDGGELSRLRTAKPGTPLGDLI